MEPINDSNNSSTEDVFDTSNNSSKSDFINISGNSSQANILSNGPNEKDQESTVVPVEPPPDGGLRAWTQVFMGHLVLINSWGYLSSFGLFQSYYATTLSTTPSAISWIGSVQIFLIYVIGTFSGRALDGGHMHTVLRLGSFLQILAIFMTSISTQYWQLFLAQGICKGIGDGLVFCPTVSLVATYFSTKRSLAMACTASGGATGGIIFPLIAQQLLTKVGFGWTVRVMGFVVLANTAVVLTIARVRLPPRQQGPLVEWEAFKDPSYTFFCIGVFFNMWAVYFAYFYISTYGTTIIGISPSTSLTLLLVMNAVGIPGRVLCGFIADRFIGPVNTLIPVAFCAGVLFYSWAGISTLGGLYAFCIVYGYFGAAIQSLFPASCASLTTDVKKMGVRTGMCFSFCSLSCLTGAPIAGALIQMNNGNFLYAQMFGGSAMLGGSLTLIAAKISKDRREKEEPRG
ncbi:MFS general substrate transporter [Corynespora cassiicola Philippines]|uniref:MFS general substrate transporter n=1 Tax=Corynespora cassiicola Philippines TaxID=1448308 RepID=A0A2T2NY02_CORCC|nr:MFS general substrate transporter [Corynespora cassiicola Philippines]